MELYSEGLSDQNLEIVYSAGKRGPDAVTASKSHDGFDNDPATMKVLSRTFWSFSKRQLVGVAILPGPTRKTVLPS
jgi:hypothetical protein